MNLFPSIVDVVVTLSRFSIAQLTMFDYSALALAMASYRCVEKLDKSTGDWEALYLLRVVGLLAVNPLE